MKFVHVHIRVFSNERVLVHVLWKNEHVHLDVNLIFFCTNSLLAVNIKTHKYIIALK